MSGLPGNSSPNLLIVGGRFEADNAALFGHLVRAGQGRIALVTAASEHPEEVGGDIIAAAQRYGLQVFPLSLTPDRPETAFDPAQVSLLRDIGHVYFSGGDQNRIMAALVQDSKITPMLSAIRDIAAAGGLIAGSSAGAAIMSDPMIAGGDPADAITLGVGEDGGVQIRPGLGFLPHSLIDQHFLARGRAGRLLAGLVGNPDLLGLGVDENTGLAVEGNRATVIGESRVCAIRWLDSNKTDDHFEIGIFNNGASFDIDAMRLSQPLDIQPDRKEFFMPFDPFSGEDQVRLFSKARDLNGDILRMVWDDPVGVSEVRLRLSWQGQGQGAGQQGPVSDVYRLSLRHIH